MSNKNVAKSFNDSPREDKEGCIITGSDIIIKKRPSITSDTTSTLSSKSSPDAQSATPITVTSASSTVCRICHTNTPNESLISPCNCKGTLAHVHLSCLERWLNQSSRSYCELCMYHYNAVQTLRYGLWEGILMWSRHPRNRMHVQSDILISILLTIVTGEGKKIGISRAWTKGSICFFLVLVVTSYLATLYLVIRDQVVPWYTWWKNTVNVRLLLSTSNNECSETTV
ncbi:hypothetical protein FQR65_LT10500 [Abscondita terminalis]|nr:hypothetical protein FQR65_LT10500 [Abscondita terminalis]